MALASDDAIHVFRNTPGLVETVRSLSSYTAQEKIRRKWMKYPIEKVKRLLQRLRNNKGEEPSQTAFLAAAAMKSGILGEIQGTSNKILAALGHNVFIPKTAGQRGLRILSLDGGGTRGIASIAIMRSIVDSLGGTEICDSFDLIAGTSTGAIIAFLIGLRRESNKQAKKRYDELIEKIFVKNSLSAPMMLLTTASYSEVPFTQIMTDILGENSMIDSRTDPRVPLVFCVSAKMTSTTSKLCLFRNYNYSGGEKKDTFVVSPKDARKKLGFMCNDSTEEHHFHEESLTMEEKVASRHEGEFFDTCTFLSVVF
jgi:Patatin